MHMDFPAPLTDPTWGSYHEREPMPDTTWMDRSQKEDILVIQERTKHNQPIKKKANEMIFIDILLLS